MVDVERRVEQPDRHALAAEPHLPDRRDVDVDRGPSRQRRRRAGDDAQASGTAATLYGVQCPDGSTCYAVGSGGTILRRG